MKYKHKAVEVFECETRVNQIELEKLNKELSNTQVELAAEKAHYFDLYNLAPVGYLTLSEKNVIMETNLTASSLLQLTRDEMINRKITDFIFRGNQDIYSMHKKKLFKAGRNQKFELQLVKKDGSHLWTQLTTAKVKKVNGTLECLMIISDITDRKRQAETIADEKSLLETTLNSAGDGVISTDNEGNVVFLNKVAESLTGWTQESARERPIDEVYNIINEHTQEKYEDIVKEVLKSGTAQEITDKTVLISKEGTQHHIEDSTAPIIQENGETVGAVLIFRDCSERNEKQEEILYLSYHDHLTGLYNRRFYEEELMRLDTARNLPLTLVMGDVNGLKFINDTLGHAMGDILLKSVADVISKGCRCDDIVSRIGGDEFVIILPKTGTKEAMEIIRRIDELAEKGNDSMDISISFGYETKHREEENIHDIFKNAEEQMYGNKQIHALENPDICENDVLCEGSRSGD